MSFSRIAKGVAVAEPMTTVVEGPLLPTGARDTDPGPTASTFPHESARGEDAWWGASVDLQFLRTAKGKTS